MLQTILGQLQKGKKSPSLRLCQILQKCSILNLHRLLKHWPIIYSCVGSLSHGKPLAARQEFLLSVFTHCTKCHNLLHLPEFQPCIIAFCLWKGIVPLVCLFPQIPGKLCFAFRFHIALPQYSLAEADDGISKHYQATCLHQQNSKHRKEMNIHRSTASININKHVGKGR